MNSPVDIVYTWVDDSQPGFLESLGQYASNETDRNPNRTRDNLDLLKYSLRSVERHLKCHGNIFLFTSRPQKPVWLNRNSEKIHVIHHDEIINKCYLPTFNSFCIVSHIAMLDKVSDPFLYIEDDMLFASNTTIDDFITKDQKIIIYPRLEKTTPAEKQHDDTQPPWNKALSFTNHLLDSRYGRQTRHSINRVPILIFKKSWRKMIKRWQDAFEFTWRSRFRGLYNVAPEYLYPYSRFYEQQAILATYRETYRKSFYLGLDNNLLLAKAGIIMLEKIRPCFYCLNDNFGETPNPRVEAVVRQFLEKMYPAKSGFEV